MERVERDTRGLSNEASECWGSLECGGSERGASEHSGFAHQRARRGGLGLLVLLVAAGAAASAACQGTQGGAGVGGQSGDEGRRPGSTWLGTGGVAAVPARP